LSETILETNRVQWRRRHGVIDVAARKLPQGLTKLVGDFEVEHRHEKSRDDGILELGELARR
jgi:hypothetical protein